MIIRIVRRHMLPGGRVSRDAAAPTPAALAAELPAAVAAALAESPLAPSGPETDTSPGADAPGAVDAVMRVVRARVTPGPVPSSDAGPAPGAGPARRHRGWGRMGPWSWRRGVAAASAAIGLVAATRAWSGRWDAPDRPAAPHAPPPAGLAMSTPPVTARPAQFFVRAPGARRVTVVGDFNGWRPEATPMRRAGDAGTWTADVMLPEGRYVYAYLIDGTRWMSDPNAPLAPADGFGRQSSVLVLSAQYAVR